MRSMYSHEYLKPWLASRNESGGKMTLAVNFQVLRLETTYFYLISAAEQAATNFSKDRDSGIKILNRTVQEAVREELSVIEPKWEVGHFCTC